MNKSHINLSVIADNIGDYIVIIDKDYTVSFANEAASDFFNCNCKNIIGQEFHDIAVERELKMVELKKDIESLKKKPVKLAI